MPNCGLFWKNVQNCGFNVCIIQYLNVFFSDVPKKMGLKKHKADPISPDKKGQDCSKLAPKSAPKSAPNSAPNAALVLSKSEERGESHRDNCKVLVQNQNPFVLPENSRALAAYYAENTALPRAALVERSPKRPIGLSKSAQKSAQALVERSPKRPIGLSKSAQKSAQALVERSPKEMRSPRRPQGQRKSGKICIHLKYKRF